ncbi:MAG: hypothetical protein IIC81_01555 [Chloroflexi bacterium]|nr:hypothetical protein [Chloroflexota bacterium]
MWRIRALVLMGVLVGMLIFGAVGVYAGWYWNSQTDVEGTSLRTIWTVVGDEGAARITMLSLTPPCLKEPR